MDKVNYELMLCKFNDFISLIDNDDELLFNAVELKSDFIDLFGLESGE